MAAAETVDPKKEIPKASKQVIYRILIFYGVNLLLVGLIVPATSPLYSGEGSSSRHSPFVIAIQLAVCLLYFLEVGQKLTTSKGYQSFALNFQRRHPYCRHECRQFLYFWLNQNYPGFGCKRSVITGYHKEHDQKLTLDTRHGTQVLGLHRQEGPSFGSHRPSAPLWMSRIHQLGAQRRRYLQLAPRLVWSLNPIHLRWYWSCPRPIPSCLVSENKKKSMFSKNH